MKKTFLFFLTLFVFLVTISSYGQNRNSLGKNKDKITNTKDSAVKEDTKEEPIILTEYIATDLIYNPDIVFVLPSKKLKLKVTLLEIQSDVTQNEKLAHLSINQHVRYESKGKAIMPISKDVKRVKKNSAECPLGHLDNPDKIEAPRLNDYWEGATALFCGYRNNQIHVPQSKQPLTRSPNINHSVVFEITPEQANDKNAEFLIDTFVVEYSTSFGRNADIILNHDPRRTKVAIHDVLAILQGNKKLHEDTSYVKDGGVPASFKFDHFDGISLPLRNVNKNGKMILEGPIRARSKGKLIEKAFVWMRFELID